MTDRPILFSAPMVRALLDGTKTQTRRVLIPQPPGWVYPDDKPGYSCLTPKGHIEFRGRYVDDDGYDHGPASKFIKLPYGKGDRLWVRESWNVFGFSEDGECATPLAGIPTKQQFDEVNEEAIRGYWQIVHSESERAREWFADQKWRPSIHMPRWASRLTLTVTDVRVQRLKDISEDDAIAEGVVKVRDGGYVAKGTAADLAGLCHNSAITAFAMLWNAIDGPDAWCANPWVVAVSFTVEQRNIDAIGAAA